MVALVQELSIIVVCGEADVVSFTILVAQTINHHLSEPFSAQTILLHLEHSALMVALSRGTSAVPALGVVGGGELDPGDLLQVGAHQEHLEALLLQDRHAALVVGDGGAGGVE